MASRPSARAMSCALAGLGLTVLASISQCHAQSAQSAHLIQAKPFQMEDALQSARNTVKSFAERLKSELSGAIKTDGAANAVGLCQTLSPDIPTRLSDETGFDISRTSLKLRNPENAPGPWELDVLKKFEKQAAGGADPSRLEFYEVVTTPDGDKLFRYMKGIAVGEMCLSCHGTDIKPDVKTELDRFYPDDKATGYHLGELRGAFSLIKYINE
ncbi:MAG: DUF3365 domain-containing protein [Hyphomicrobiaceae bacterium]